MAVDSARDREKSDHFVVLGRSRGNCTHPGLGSSARPGCDRSLPAYLQLGSQICMFHVACEIGMPVRTGNSQTKFVITSAR